MPRSIVSGMPLRGTLELIYPKQMANPEINTILQNNPRFADLDYASLRTLGLQYLGDLSGSIWTDHNAHDPGITTMEMLCYALLDLGYRTKLPVGQIFAEENASNPDFPQFFSPAEILSSQPCTILDYRRLLLDIAGIKNAWLEVVRDYEVRVLTDNSDPNNPNRTAASLNGLYQITLQLDPDSQRTEAEILTAVRQSLLAHRNLGEDFVNLDCPIILEACPIPIESQIEIGPTADPAIVFAEISKVIEQYFCPELAYYSLAELLARGKAIEDIYAGRPHTTNSFGFIDPEELQAIRQRKEIHFSDLYGLIMEIEGVVRIRSLRTNKNLPRVESLSPPLDPSSCQTTDPWLQHLPDGTYPIFDLAGSQIRLFRKQESYDSQSLLAGSQRLNDRQKVRFDKAVPHLDLPLPTNRHLPDLADYYSIQHEFPRVYGIGQDGLGPAANTARKAKALQFKGFLLFFERLLADFLAQLGALKSHFALIPESARPQAYRHTYFAQTLDSVPQIEWLNRLEAESTRFDWQKGSTIARLIAKKDLLAAQAASPLEVEPGFT
ncbi:MAG: hypothetical protein AAGM67_02710, partial [Bacteroidota bacterium]